MSQAKLNQAICWQSWDLQDQVLHLQNLSQAVPACQTSHDRLHPRNITGSLRLVFLLGLASPWLLAFSMNLVIALKQGQWQCKCLLGEAYARCIAWACGSHMMHAAHSQPFQFSRHD